MNKVMTRAGFRFAAIVGIAVMGLAPATLAAPGGGPPGGGPPGGGFGPPGGFGAQSPRSPESRSGDSNGYDFSGPKFQFSMRKKPPAAQNDTPQNRDETPDPADQDKTGFWTNLKSGFGLFGPGN